jgi:3-hydroxy acid dehydrogenase/malonic semialdehyde reductase
LHRIAVVTGSSSGIGQAIATRLLEAGFAVIGLARHHNQYTLKHAHYHPRVVDLSDIESLDRIAVEISKNYPKISVVVCNAGFGDFRNLENFSHTQIQEFLNVNLVSHIVLCRHMVSGMKKLGQGDIVIVGSEAALIGKRKATLYSSAKFGMRGFAQSLRDEVGSSGLRVCLINPGMVRSAFFDNLDFEPGSSSENAMEPDDIAKIIVEVVEVRRGTVIDEINLSPASKVVHFKTKKS